MSRRNREHGHVNHERWLVSYADFITLLFAFFVVLYASSQVDNQKIVKVSKAIQGGFQQLGAFSGSYPPPPTSVEAAEDVPPELKEIMLNSNIEGRPKGAPAAVDVDRLKRELEQALGEEIRNHEIQMRVTPEGLVVSLREVGFFKSGEAVLLPGGLVTLTRIAHVLNTQGFQIRVEGHTDNVPIHNPQFKSNWELSTARATEVISLMVERYGFDPQGVSAAGYAQYRPIASNDNADGRQSNRRVDLVVVSRTYHSDKSLPSEGSGQQ
jgi:chemotaxis protein MotB